MRRPHAKNFVGKASSIMGKSEKTHVIEAIFKSRWDPGTNALEGDLVTLDEVADCIRDLKLKLSDRNPANFFKDFVRKRSSANTNWPQAVFAAGYTGRQETGGSTCFRFIRVSPGQTEPFPDVFQPNASASRVMIESASLPLASRRLGRTDESWLMQVLVRLRVIETHLSLFSLKKFAQIDHLQMSVKLKNTEIDALFLGLTDSTPTTESLICCEAKGRSDDILMEQVVRQARTLFTNGYAKTEVVPMAAKAIAPSEVYVVEFVPIAAEDASETEVLQRASEAIFQFLPAIPGIGE